MSIADVVSEVSNANATARRIVLRTATRPLRPSAMFTGTFGPRGLLFAFNCTVAALVALYVGVSFGLPNPWWAALTVFITSQPMAAAAGAVVARAVYRIAGTVAGVIAALVIVPELSSEPMWLIAAVAAWVASCLYLSLIDRTPRAYAFMLAGYTLALIGLPLAGDPSMAFDSAVSRIEEITIGAVCAACMHCLVFPRSVGSSVQAKVDIIMKDMRGWLSNAMSVQGADARERDLRRRLATELTELEVLAALARHEPGSDAAAAHVVRSLGQRLTMLLPLLTDVDDRVRVLARDETLGEELPDLLAEMRTWIAEGNATGNADDSRRRVDRRLERLRRSQDDPEGASHWRWALLASLLRSLEELARAWSDSLQLAARLQSRAEPAHQRMPRAPAACRARALHVDHGLAAYSALAAAVTVMLAAGLAVATDWPQGVVAVGIAAAGASVFAFIDDPRPMQRTFVVWTFVSIPVSALYVFAILPAVDGFAVLALALTPLLFGTALYLASPRHWLPALAFALVSQTLIALQSSAVGDFATFTTFTFAGLAGALIALTVTSLIRVIDAPTSALRILRAGWRDLAALACADKGMTTAAWSSLMLDRVGLLQPRLARVVDVERFRHVDALGDLRVGVAIVELREFATDGDASVACAVDDVLTRLAQHFRARVRHPHVVPDTTLLRAIDFALDRLFAKVAADERWRAVSAVVGIRRGMFADAPPYRAEILQ